MVTHSLAVADRLVGSEHVAVHLLAGRLLGRQSIVLGPLTARTAGEFEYDLAFLGAEAVNAAGAFNTQEDVVTLQRAVAARAAKSAVCVTAGKFGKNGADRLCCRWRRSICSSPTPSPAAWRRRGSNCGRGNWSGREEVFE